ncbi:DegT/DnrJ/EryC1/StrS family aminotransferase [Alphaproteobacteria bacterium]|nr:DegT/DnrJ/EryC1/StrS family aminotransferase [Alphaproteobacteria bacterium]
MVINNNKLINIAEPSTDSREADALKSPLETGWLTQGPKVKAFEEAFSKRHSVSYSLATTSCTSALHLALATLDIGEGDEVIVPAFTWVATANVIVYCGAKPVFIDVDVKTYNLDTSKLKELINKNTRAIIPVHLFGLCSDISKIRSIVNKDIAIIEDAACAVGATCRGESAGSLGEFGCFSFHPRKIITTGEGGMLTTNNNDYFNRANILRNHGASISEEIRHQGSKPYLLPNFEVLGFNYRMTDFQGSIGLVQLDKLNNFIDERSKWANWYTNSLSDIPWIITPYSPEGFGHSWQAYVVLVDEDKTNYSRNQIMEKLAEKGISTRPGTHAVTELGYYKNILGIDSNKFPIASKLEKNSMAIPLHNKMTEEDFFYISEELHRL